MNKFLLLLISIVLFASSINEDLINFDKSFLVSSKQEQLAIHQKLKTLYIKSIISGDNETKKEVLKRIILSSKILKLDSSTYEKELLDLGVNPKQLSFNKNTETKKNIIQNNISKTTKIDKEEENNNLYIVKTNFSNDLLELKLKGELTENNIKMFDYNTKENKNKIIEFDGILDTGKQNYNTNSYEISIVQFNPKKARIVFRSKEELMLQMNLDNNLNIIVLNSKSNQSKKVKENKNTKQVNDEQKEELNKAKEELIVKENIKNNDTKENKINTTNYINKIIKNNETIELNMSNNAENIKTFSYGTNQILEFDGVLIGGRKNFDYKNYSISVLQFNPKRVRVVLYSKTKKNLYYEVEDNKLNISSNEQSKINKPRFDKSNLLITLDAGHGGKDTGASAYGRNEKDIVLSIVLKLEKALKQKGYKVFLTRKKDTYIGLRDRTKMANDKKSDLFISIHANSIADKTKFDKIYGIETYFLSPARSERSKNAAAIENKSDIEEMNYFSKQTFLNFLNREKIISSNKLAIDIQGGILNSIPKNYLKKDGGVKEAPFWVLVGALMPAVLIEIGYISHPIESKNIADLKYQEYLVNGIVNGIESYFIKNK